MYHKFLETRELHCLQWEVVNSKLAKACWGEQVYEVVSKNVGLMKKKMDLDYL